MKEGERKKEKKEDEKKNTMEEELNLFPSGLVDGINFGLGLLAIKHESKTTLGHHQTKIPTQIQQQKQKKKRRGKPWGNVEKRAGECMNDD